MNTRTSADATADVHADARKVWSRISVVVVAAVVGVSALHAIVYGPAIRERAEQLKAAQIDQENRALCEKLGMPHGSDKFPACAGALSEARQREAERIATEAAGIL